MSIFGLLLNTLGCIKNPSPTDVNYQKPPQKRDTEIQGFLDKQAISDEILSHHELLRSCYERRFFNKPNSPGKILVELMITTDGTVDSASASAREDTLGSEKVSECILDVFMKMQFPAGMKTDIPKDREEFPEGVNGVKIKYPLVFSME
jgi:hypothetical protein